MHGRLKVRSTEEELARKKKEQALKVKAYRAAMSRIQAKRSAQELDDEMLTLTAQVLLRNPDITTLWNIRRECIFTKTTAATEDMDEAKRQTVFDADLGLTEQCLMVSPKSYGSWHHRCWILEHSPKANWDREVQLCNKYLNLDERNFHTWDYRRYVVAKAGIGKQQELDFCTQKIKTNFSNYSSWHYRSQLLPVLFPYEGDGWPRRPMSEEKLKEELEMVLTAAFTDPNDSSAWFYQRWLLRNSRPELDICGFRMNEKIAMVTFTKSVARNDFQASVPGLPDAIKLNWVSLSKSDIDTTWLAAISTETNIDFASTSSWTLEINIPGNASKQLQLAHYPDGLSYFKPPNVSSAFSAAVITELETQLESCNSLLEYEPDSKWTLLTSSLLMRAIDRKKYHTKSLDYLQKLQKVDALREGYYKDLASKWVLEELLEEWQNSKDFPTKLNLSAAENLTSLCYEQYLCMADAVELPKELQMLQDKLKTFTSMAL